MSTEAAPGDQSSDKDRGDQTADALGGLVAHPRGADHQPVDLVRHLLRHPSLDETVLIGVGEDSGMVGRPRSRLREAPDGVAVGPGSVMARFCERLPPPVNPVGRPR